MYHLSAFKKIFSLIIAVMFVMTPMTEPVMASGDMDTETMADSWRYHNGRIIEQGPSMSLYSTGPDAWSQQDDGTFVNGKGSVIKGAVRKGIDVSKFNETIDWERVMKTDVDFAIIRCGYGGDHMDQDDVQFERNVSECERLGIPYGVYLYSYATTTDNVMSEVRHTLRMLEGHRPSYPVYYDLEDDTIAPLGKDKITSFAELYCSEIEKNGYEAGIYANKYWWEKYLSSPKLNIYDRWVAQWGNTCTYRGSYSMWQCADDGSIPGVPSQFTDIDFDFRNTAGWETIGTKRYYNDRKGDHYKLQWKDIGSDRYYFDMYGAAATGKYEVEGHMRYFDSQGRLYRSRWISWDGERFFVDDRGIRIRSGWIEENGNTCYLDAAGAKVKGCQHIAGNTYFFTDTGELIKNTWVTHEGVRYHVNEKGMVDETFSEDTKIDAPDVLSWTRVSPSSMKVTWKDGGKMADGYEVSYSKARDFSGSRTADAGSSSSFTVKGLDENASYYVRVRAYVMSGDRKHCSQWTEYAPSMKDGNISSRFVSRDGRALELREAAGQVSGGYDCVQGMCTDGTYGYYILSDYEDGKCMIVKARMSDSSIVKVSDPLRIKNGNDMTYNSDEDRLVAVYTGKAPYRVCVIDPDTLRPVSYRTVKTPSSYSDRIHGFSGIAYSPERKQYVLRLSGCDDYILTDGKLSAVKYMTIDRRCEGANQGMEADGDYIYDVKSVSKKYATVCIYDWDGRYICGKKLNTTRTVQGIFKAGDRFYTGVYGYAFRTYNVKYYTTRNVRKKVNGKWVYRKQYVYRTVIKNGKRVRVMATHTVKKKKLITKDYVYDIGTLR